MESGWILAERRDTTTDEGSTDTPITNILLEEPNKRRSAAIDCERKSLRYQNDIFDHSDHSLRHMSRLRGRRQSSYIYIYTSVPRFGI